MLSAEDFNEDSIDLATAMRAAYLTWFEARVNSEEELPCDVVIAGIIRTLVSVTVALATNVADDTRESQALHISHIADEVVRCYTDTISEMLDRHDAAVESTGATKH